MGNVAIQVENLTKEYRLGVINHGTLRQDLQSWFARMRGQDDPNSLVTTTPSRHTVQSSSANGRFLALDDISFEVGQGEVLGIIGRNGAGKSTLLKIMSRITTPTQGTIRLKGRVASLLEVGTGFHPELTGRENVYLNGAILGMSKSEIKRKFDEIVAFAEVDAFIDTPVKRYSSGMYVRLAFAVAAHLEPEILIIDEVLAVGDALFQKKCLNKMENVGREGRTVLFVSHNMGAIHSLTQKCAYLENGKLKCFADTNEVVEKYLSESFNSESSNVLKLDYYRPEYVVKAYKDNIKVRYIDVWAEQNGEKISVLDMGSHVSIYFDLEVYSDIHGANLSLSLLNAEGQYVTVVFSWDDNYYVDLTPGRHIIQLDIANIVLTPGQYYIITGINQTDTTTPWDAIFHFPIFEIRNTGKILHWLHRPKSAVHCDNVLWKQIS